MGNFKKTDQLTKE